MQRTDAGPASFPLAELRHAVDSAITAWLDRGGSASGDPDTLAAAHRWALSPPGKLLRPIALLASAGAVGGPYDTVMPAAVGIELAHVATLVHDDIIDGDELRRGKVAAHREFGLAHGVLAADSLFFALFQQLGACRRTGVPDRCVLDAVEALGAAGQQTARGVAQEIALSGGLRAVTEPADGGIAAYVEMARLKSASLFRAACQVGALLGGGGPERARVLAAYGEAMGIAFQIRDDLLPYVSDGERTGKPVCSDLRNRRPALPVLLAHRLGGRAERAALAELVDGTTDERARQRRLTRLAADTGALHAAQSMARAYVERCHRALAPVPAGADRDRLAWLADEVAGTAYDHDDGRDDGHGNGHGNGRGNGRGDGRGPDGGRGRDRGQGRGQGTQPDQGLGLGHGPERERDHAHVPRAEAVTGGHRPGRPGGDQP